MKNGLNERNRKSEMIDRECGTKQLKSVITKENLKKPEQTQKKTSEQIVFVGLWVWYFLESQNLTVLCEISKKRTKRTKNGELCCKLVSVGQFLDCGPENWQGDTR